LAFSLIRRDAAHELENKPPQQELGRQCVKEIILINKDTRILPTPQGRQRQIARQHEVFASLLETSTANWAVCPARIMSTAMSASARNAELDLEQILDAGIEAFTNATQFWRGHCPTIYRCPLAVSIMESVSGFVEITAALSEPTAPCEGGTNEQRTR
jgi:hypothetical protein